MLPAAASPVTAGSSTLEGSPDRGGHGLSGEPRAEFGQMAIVREHLAGRRVSEQIAVLETPRREERHQFPEGSHLGPQEFQVRVDVGDGAPRVIPSLPELDGEALRELHQLPGEISMSVDRGVGAQEFLGSDDE